MAKWKLKELADYVERKHYGRKTSHKCKIGISGCGRNCPDAMVKDIAFLLVHPKVSCWLLVAIQECDQRLVKYWPESFTVEQSKKAVDILVDWYAEHGGASERMGKNVLELPG